MNQLLQDTKLLDDYIEFEKAIKSIEGIELETNEICAMFLRLKHKDKMHQKISVHKAAEDLNHIISNIATGCSPREEYVRDGKSFRYKIYFKDGSIQYGSFMHDLSEPPTVENLMKNVYQILKNKEIDYRYFHML